MDSQLEVLKRFAKENEAQDSPLYRKDNNINAIIRKAAENYELYYNLQHNSQNLKMGGGSILFVLLRNNGEIEQQRLSKVMPVTRQSITDALKILEKRGFIEREVDEGDRRKRTIRLTEKGLTVLGFSLPLRKEFNEKLVKCLSVEEWDSLIDLISRVNAFYDSEIKQIIKEQRKRKRQMKTAVQKMSLK
jgi:DNA-binding MarR family transcriptional regulator